MKEPYHIVTRAARESAAVIEQFCQANGQILLPIVNLIQNASCPASTTLSGKRQLFFPSSDNYFLGGAGRRQGGGR